MFFKIKNKRFLSPEQLKTNTLLDAYVMIQHYPLHASELLLDDFINKQYGVSLKNMCIRLLLNLTFYKENTGDIILMFKDPKYDTIASLITYGNGIIRGSRILKIALNG